MGGNGKGNWAEWKGSRRNWEEKGAVRGRIRAGFPLFIYYSSLWVCFFLFSSLFRLLIPFSWSNGGWRGGGVVKLQEELSHFDSESFNDSESFEAMRKPWNS